jgi:thiamine pyrophosphokinase
LLGIVFTGAGGPPPETAGDLLKRRQAPKLIAAADSGLIAAEAAGFSPDWIIGDMDSLDDDKRLEKYPAEKVIRFPVDKDYTDTELAFSLLREKGCDEVWLFGGGGGRLDHLLAIRSLFERDPYPSRWITAAEDVRCIQAPEEFHAHSDLISVFPLGIGPWKAFSRGLKWPLDGLSWDRGFFGVSNLAPEGEFSIRAEAGRFLIIRPLAV